jgi:hypothetical protein
MESLEIISFDGKTGICMKGKNAASRQPIHTILCVDTSMSMDMDNKLVNVKKSLDIFTKCLSTGDAVSLITFDSISRIILKAIVVSDATRAIIESAVRQIRTNGSTNISAGLLNCFNCVENDSDRTQGILLLTDGNANQGEVRVEKIIEMSTIFLRRSPALTLTTIAYGLDHNADLLKSLATIGVGSYNLVENLEDVATVFGSVLGSMLSIVCQNVSIKLAGNCEMITGQQISVNGDRRDIIVGDLHSEESIVVIMTNAEMSSNFDIGWYDADMGEMKRNIESTIIPSADASLIPLWFTLTMYQQSVAKLIGKGCSIEEIEDELMILRTSGLADHPVIKKLIQELLEVKQMLSTMSRTNANVSMIQRSCVLTLGRGVSSPSRNTYNVDEEDPLAPQNSAMRQASQLLRTLTVQPEAPEQEAPS